jgi:hypothetical protein
LDEKRHLYILTLDKGEFFLGHTDNLRNELDAHYSGARTETSGKNPQLVWTDVWYGNRDKLIQHIDYLLDLFEEDPRNLLYKLQARLPMGGIVWWTSNGYWG